MKKVLILTYYWPPAGGPGVQRVLKFAKYLPEFGWEPLIYTVENGEYLAFDESLVKEIPQNIKIYRRKIWEPTKLYKKIVGLPENAPIPTGAASEETDSIKKKLSAWIRLNCFIPDAKLMMPFQMYQFGKKIIQEQEPDILFSSGPPHSIHLLVYRLKKWSQLPWVADFRDPWTNIFYYKDRKRFFLSALIDSSLEKKVLLSANARITVGQQCACELREKELNLPFDIIYNGYDEADFKKINVDINRDYFFITFTGNMNKYRNPVTLWKDLVYLKNQNDEILSKLKIRLIGVVHPKIKEMIYNLGIQDYVQIEGYKPHEEAIRSLRESSMLLLPISNSRGNLMNVTGKIFEYLAAQRYILAIGPEEGEAARILKLTQSGEIFGYEESTLPFIRKIYKLWESGSCKPDNSSQIARFSRREETHQLANIFDKVLRR